MVSTKRMLPITLAITSEEVDTIAEETDSSKQGAFSHASSGEDDVFAWSQVLDCINLFHVFNAHIGHAFTLFVGIAGKTAHHIAVQAAQGGSREDTFRSSAGAHHSVDTGSNHGRCDSGSEVPVGNEPDASTSLADIRNQFFVARAFKDNNYQIVNFTVERFGDIPQVIADWGIQIDRALAGRTDHDFLQIAIRSVKQAVPLAGCQHRNRSWRTGRTQVGALERIDRNIDLRIGGTVGILA